MAFVPVPNCIKLVLEFTIAGQEVVVTLSLRKAGSIGLIDLSNAITDGFAWASAELMPHQSDQLSLVSGSAYDLTSVTAPVEQGTPASPIVGGDSSPALPNSTSAVLSFRTAGRGRSSRGRMYVPGLPTSAKTNAIGFSSGYLAAMIAAASAINSYFNPDGLEQVIISRVTGGVPRTTGLAQTVTGVVVDGLFDSQRRRLGGRGR